MSSRERLNDAILQALRRDPASRFHSADAMARALGAAGDEAVELHDADETRVIALPSDRSYVPPPVTSRAASPGRAPARRPPPRSPRRSAFAPLLGTLLVLVAAGLVVVFVILPLLDLGAGGGSSGQSASATAAPSAPAGTVLITVRDIHVGQ